MVRLTADVMQLARNTGAVSTKALEALQENPVLWGLENTEAHARFNRMWRILVALYFSVELKRCLNTVLWIIFKQDPDNINALKSQPLFIRPPPLLLRFLYDTVQSSLQFLAEIDHQQWNAVRARLSTWGVGKFDEPMTLDSLMQQNDVQSSRRIIVNGLYCLLYSVGRSKTSMINHLDTDSPSDEAMREIRERRTMSDEQLERIKVLQNLFNDIGDITELCPYSIGNWMGRMMPEVAFEGGPTPSRAVELAWYTLDSCQPPIEELFICAKNQPRGLEREVLSTGPLASTTAEEPSAAKDAPQQNASNIPQEDASSKSQADEQLQLDLASLAEYDQLFVQQDREGGCILTDDRSEITSMIARKCPMLYSHYEEDDTENIESYGKDGATLLAERPFRRVLNRDNESMITKEMGLLMEFAVKEEVEKCAIDFWGMLCQRIITLSVADMRTDSSKELEQVDPASAHEYRRRCLYQMSVEMAMARMYQETEAEKAERAKIAAVRADLERVLKEFYDDVERMTMR